MLRAIASRSFFPCATFVKQTLLASRLHTGFEKSRFRGGCGRKISAKDLKEILKHLNPDFQNPNFNARLLVGPEHSDDAAVIANGPNQSIICTTDFFTPIVNDPFDFGRISATNALSDIYAMGGTPLVALAILGWPLKRLGASVAARVMEGGKSVCHQAGVHLAGGHSLMTTDEAIFGLAVTGSVLPSNLKKNSTATSECDIYLSKPIGSGLLTSAFKDSLKAEDNLFLENAIKVMCELNTLGSELGHYSQVHAMTDITGFGLAGHLYEMCKGSRLSAVLNVESIPLMEGFDKALLLSTQQGGMKRNKESFEEYIISDHSIRSKEEAILFDPQTSGGLLIAAERSKGFVPKKKLFRIGSFQAPTQKRSAIILQQN